MSKDGVLFKVLHSNGSAIYGQGTWNLPKRGKPGDWMPPIEGELVPCENGYHLCRPRDLIRWLGPAIYEAEYRGERVNADDKVVVREARLVRRVGRWNDRTARLFACWCAEQVVHLCGDDPRPREAIRVARLFACGKATAGEAAAAGAAAWDAARAAAWSAAWSAAGAAAWDAAWDAARDAARSAAGAAAWDAAWDAAGDAARAAQTRELMRRLGYPESHSARSQCVVLEDKR